MSRRQSDARPAHASATPVRAGAADADAHVVMQDVEVSPVAPVDAVLGREQWRRVLGPGVGLFGLILLPFAMLLIVGELIAPLTPTAEEPTDENPAPASPPRPIKMPRSPRSRGRRAA